MNLTDEHLDLLFSAWTLSTQNWGMVVHDDRYPAAQNSPSTAGWSAGVSPTASSAGGGHREPTPRWSARSLRCSTSDASSADEPHGGRTEG